MKRETRRMEQAVGAECGGKSVGDVDVSGSAYRWYVLVLSVVIITLVVGSTNYSFALFVKPIAAGMKLSRAAVNSGLVLFYIGTAVFSPLVGRLLDHFPARPVMLVSAALFGAGMAGVGLSASPLAMALYIAAPISAGAVGCGGLFGALVVTRWFDKGRSRALAISAMGTSLGGLVTFPVVAFLIERWGWRAALIGVGVGIWLVITALGVSLREAPSRVTGRGKGRDGWTTPGILRSPQFWIICLAISAMLGVDGALLASTTPYALDRGFSLTQVTLLMTVTTASAVLGKLLIAAVADRIDLRWLIVLTAALGVVQCAVFSTNPPLWVLFATNGLAGLAIGGTYPLYSAIVAERFGPSSYGWIRGLMTPANSVLASAAVFFAGAVYDRTHHYTLMFLVFIVAGGLAMVLMLALPKSAPQPR